MLKIELHPAELGMVTASLRLSGEQLSIELKPETHDAYRRLSTDSEAIVKSLRGLGFEVDKVTILQPSVAVPAATRTDATASLTACRQAATRPPFSPEIQAAATAEPAASNRASNPRGNATMTRKTTAARASPSRERAGDDMFI